jgi:hypothetical protein
MPLYAAIRFSKVRKKLYVIAREEERRLHRAPQHDQDQTVARLDEPATVSVGLI